MLHVSRTCRRQCRVFGYKKCCLQWERAKPIRAKIGEIVGAKEALQKKVNKKKAAHQSTDFEEFMALERVKEQEDELKQIMIYCGRPGLWNDWVRFQVEARKARREAEEASKKKIQWWIEVTIISVAMIVGVAALALFLWWLYHLQRASGV